MPSLRNLLCALILGIGVASPLLAEGPGILLLAHGGNAEWNAHVMTLVAQTDRTHPTEVAFGMAARPNIQAAVDRLQQRGVTSIVAVPLLSRRGARSSRQPSTCWLNVERLRRNLPPSPG